VKAYHAFGMIVAVSILFGAAVGHGLVHYKVRASLRWLIGVLVAVSIYSYGMWSVFNRLG
jgi:uncharacterized membrane protein YfcA